MEEAGRLKGALALFFFMEMGVEIAMSFEHIQNLERIIDIAEEDHITAKCETAHIISQFRPWATHLTRQSSKICAFAAQLFSKC